MPDQNGFRDDEKAAFKRVANALKNWWLMPANTAPGFQGQALDELIDAVEQFKRTSEI